MAFEHVISVFYFHWDGREFREVGKGHGILPPANKRDDFLKSHLKLYFQNVAVNIFEHKTIYSYMLYIFDNYIVLSMIRVTQPHNIS